MKKLILLALIPLSSFALTAEDAGKQSDAYNSCDQVVERIESHINIVSSIGDKEATVEIDTPEVQCVISKLRKDGFKVKRSWENRYRIKW